MLKIIGSVMAELGLMRQDTATRYYINISKGDAISIGAFVDNHEFFQIKASEFIDLESEYAAQVRGWNQFPDFAPQPLAYRVRAGWSIMITKGIHHAPLIFDNALRGRGSPAQALSDLYRYFEICGQHELCAGDVASHEIFFDQLHAHFSRTEYAALAERWLERGRAQGIESVAQIAQHGDFVQNNLACASKRLVIFDWEDFGTYHLPGLDICSLCFSVAPDAAALRKLMLATPEQALPLDLFVNRACSLCGFDAKLFKCLLPLYLLVFLYSKRAYGRVGQDRIGTILRQLSQ